MNDAHIAYHTQNGTASITSYLHRSIEGKYFMRTSDQK